MLIAQLHRHQKNEAASILQSVDINPVESKLLSFPYADAPKILHSYYSPKRQTSTLSQLSLLTHWYFSQNRLSLK